MKKLLLSLVLFAFSVTVSADVRLPRFFSDSMVLQRDHRIPVWGWAGSHEKVTVRFNHQSRTASADKSGKWRIDLEPEAAGGPYQLTITGKNEVVLHDVLVGDVWVCSGQSNMEFSLSGVEDAAAEIRKANFPTIRQFEVPKTVASEPREDVSGGSWKPCRPETAGGFTAVGYFFAKTLQQELNIPIGLIHTSWGGTHVETWTSREAFENSDEFRSMISGMPPLNLDSLSRQKIAEAAARIKKLQPAYPASANDIAGWKETAFDDGSWPRMQVPGLWEQGGLGEFDGVAWFRRSVEVAAADAGKPATLNLGMIDDADDCYVNGTKVGSTTGYNVARSYNIPAGVLRAGRNVIAVRVNDTGGGGGIYGEPGNLKLITGSAETQLAGEWAYQVEEVASATAGIGPNSYPTLLCNGMLHPLVPFAIKGAIWYQGESNAGRAYQYRKAFPLMIADWRKQWGQGDFPFYFVQLATFNADNGDSHKGSSWAELREAQTLTLSLPNTGMAVTTDIGNPGDIHPRNKQDVGKRLAAVALNKTYGKGNVYSGPTYQSMKIEGNKAILSFTNIGGGLEAKNKYGYLQGFEVAGADRQFHYAKAEIAGDKVVVYQEAVSQPVAVRYGWADNAEDDNLYNKEGFPAGPFRTDDWKGITESVKYEIGK